LLRNYEGLFLGPVKIREADVAKLMKVKESEITSALTQMARDGILEYEPATDKPKITFLRERVEDRNLTFDTVLINRLRENAIMRAESVEGYIDTEKCREQYLLHYFGEHSKDACGNCDLCRARRREVSYDNILLRITDEGITVKELLGTFSATDHADVKELLSSLEQDELIFLEQDKIRLRK
jgi:ATP-dependent DNA helicase RecQ